MTPEREAEIRRMVEAATGDAVPGMRPTGAALAVQELLAAIDEARRKLPCGHSLDADDDGGCTVCRLRADYEEERDRAEKAEREAAAMRAALTSAQWFRVDSNLGECQECHRSSVDGHAPDCRIGAALATDSGRGWMSPEAMDALLRDMRWRCADFVYSHMVPDGTLPTLALAWPAMIRALPLYSGKKEALP